MSTLCLSHAQVVDVTAGMILPDRYVLSRDGLIEAVAEGVPPSSADRHIDLRGRFVLPGLIDAHVHVTAVTADLPALRSMPASYVTARAIHVLRGMLMRGFTTVRDVGGADFGLAEAVMEGWIDGPRLLFGGRGLSQTGGHGDMRGRGEEACDTCFCGRGLGRVCDGADAVRHACRDEIRKGAHHIKLMVSGGVASPTDRLTNRQFSDDEIAAAVDEAAAAGIYTCAHAYSAAAINRAIELGVRSIEHGNLLDDTSLDRFLAYDAYLVPTLATYRAMAAEGTDAGVPAYLLAKLGDVLEAGAGAVERAHRRGVKLAFGTDLLGSMHRHQLTEFALRSEVQPPLAVLQAATVTAAELLQMSGQIGVVTPGALADLIAVDSNPLDDLAVLQDPDRHLHLIVKGGLVFRAPQR